MDNEVKTSAQTDKRNSVKNLASEAELDAKTGNRKTLFHITKQLSNFPPKICRSKKPMA